MGVSVCQSSGTSAVITWLTGTDTFSPCSGGQKFKIIIGRAMVLLKAPGESPSLHLLAAGAPGVLAPAALYPRVSSSVRRALVLGFRSHLHNPG